VASSERNLFGNKKEKEMSEKDKFYGKLFPGSKLVLILDDSEYNEQLAKNPERFLFSNLDKILASFMKTKPEIPLLKTAQKGQDYQEYEHDRITYQATIQVDGFRNKEGVAWKTLIIRLANDGFLYLKQSELEVLKERERHHGVKYAVLKRSEGKKIAGIQAFIASQLGIPVSQVKYDLCYSYDEDRFDICGLNDQEKWIVKVCFEPGYPAEPFEDYWKNDD